MSMVKNSKRVPHNDDTDYKCGMGSCQPHWVQWLATPKVFLFNLSIISIIQGGSHRYFIASISTLEKRYAFSSTISGLILIADNISELILALVFGYLATRVHRPRLIGFSLVMVGVGCFVAALPYFIYGPATHLLTLDPSSLSKYSTNKSVDFCDHSKNVNGDCLENSGSNTVWLAVALIFLASFINGFGFAIFMTVAIPFLDDSVKKKNSALYLSMTQF